MDKIEGWAGIIEIGQKTKENKMDKIKKSQREKVSRGTAIWDIYSKLDKIIEEHINIWEAIRDIQEKLTVMRTVVDDMVERKV